MKANPRNTSRMYVRRGYVVGDLTLADCAFSCTKCGRTVDRDYNTSLNSLRACRQEILLCFPFSEEVVYSKFPGRSKKSFE
ncbi:transposase [archaeon]|nr:transposase [archaeon]